MVVSRIMWRYHCTLLLILMLLGYTQQQILSRYSFVKLTSTLEVCKTHLYFGSLFLQGSHLSEKLLQCWQSAISRQGDGPSVGHGM